MPRTKFDKDSPIDLLLAVILERKMKRNMTYEDLAKGANVAPDYLRKLFTTKHTNDWSSDIRNSICRQLRINIETTLTLVKEDKTGIRMR